MKDLEHHPKFISVARAQIYTSITLAPASFHSMLDDAQPCPEQHQQKYLRLTVIIALSLMHRIKILFYLKSPVS